MKFSSTLTAAAFGLLVGFGGIAAASAAPVDHPRVAEVNHRLMRQEHRITTAVHEDRISFTRAERLRARERAIRARELAMMHRHDGHLTRTETRHLNRQENRVGHGL